MGRPKHQKRSRQRANGFEPIANPTQAEALRLLARSSAAGAHQSTPNRLRTRSALKRALINEQRHEH